MANKMENKIEIIEEALYKKIKKAPYNGGKCTFKLSMKKSGNTYEVQCIKTPAHRGCDHRWHSGSIYYRVINKATNETRYFKNLSGLAKTIAYGYIA